MSQQALITLNTVPYTPNGRQPNGILSWANRDGGYPASSFLTFKVTDKKGKYIKTNSRLTLPIAATASDPACGTCVGGVARMSGFNLESWVEPSSTEAERIDLITRLRDYVMSNEFYDAVVKFNYPYS